MDDHINFCCPTTSHMDLVHLNDKTSVSADPCKIGSSVSVISCLLPTQEARWQCWLGTPRMIVAPNLEDDFSKE